MKTNINGLNYKLSAKSLESIKENPALMPALMLLFGVSQNTIYRFIRENETNGALTKMAAIRLISVSTGLAEDKILVAVKANTKELQQA